MPRKSIGDYRLVDACHEPGCPVCRSVETYGRRQLDALMYEHVTDPDTRRALRRSLGFCNWHTWMLLEVPHAKSGAAIVYEDLVRACIARFRRLAGDGSRSTKRSWIARRLGPRRRRDAAVDSRRRCAVCARCAEAEARLLRSMLQHADDQELFDAYARSDGLCVPHARALVELGAGSAAAQRLLDQTIEKWTMLARDLDRFVAKHDYRNREPFTDTEASSYTRAFDTLAGRRGVFGNDLRRED